MPPWSLLIRTVPLAWLVPSAIAYTVTPSLMTLRPTGAASSAFLHIQNKERKPRAIEMIVREHRKDIDGQTIEGKEADDEFLIYPSQIILLPGDEVGVQLRWVGDPKPTIERTFTLLAGEVAVPDKDADPEPTDRIQVRINVLMNYAVKVYITPAGAKPSVVVESVTSRPTPQGTDASRAATDSLEIVLANRGNAHAVLTETSLVLLPAGIGAADSGKASVTVPAKDIPAMRPHLLAGDKRRILIPRPPGLPAGPVQVMLSR